MRKSKFTKSQIVAILKEGEAGVKINVSPGRTWAIWVGAQPCTLALDAPFAAVVSQLQYSSSAYSAHDVH